MDFARDLRIPGSRPYLKAQARHAVQSGLPVVVYLTERQLGFTYMGVAGGDRLRIYHKGLEAAKKFGWDRMPLWLADVVRVELQLRKGQLDDKLREDVRTLQTARVERAPQESDVPVMKVKPSRGHGLRRRHLGAMKRDWHSPRCVEATEAVDQFLGEQGLDQLIPGMFTEIPEPMYGKTPQHMARR